MNNIIAFALETFFLIFEHFLILTNRYFHTCKNPFYCLISFTRYRV